MVWRRESYESRSWTELSRHGILKAKCYATLESMCGTRPDESRRDAMNNLKEEIM